jgi:hypothetical protein
MKIIVVKKCNHGPVGKVIEGPEVWRNCFATSLGVVCLPIDDEAKAAVAKVVAEMQPVFADHLQGYMAEAVAILPAALAAAKAATQTDSGPAAE